MTILVIKSAYFSRETRKNATENRGPVLEDKTKEVHDVIYWEHEGNRAVRQGNWKLVAENEAEWELYELKNDRSELNNLATKHPDKVKELSELYEKWEQRCGVVRPKVLNKKK